MKKLSKEIEVIKKENGNFKTEKYTNGSYKLAEWAQQ